MTQFWLETIGVVATILAVAGVLLNNRRMIQCFYIWMISNALSAYLHYDTGLYSLLLRDVVFLALAFEGVIRWRKKGG